MKIRELISGLQLPEGPAAMNDGSIVLVEIACGTVTRVAAGGKVDGSHAFNGFARINVTYGQ